MKDQLIILLEEDTRLLFSWLELDKDQKMILLEVCKSVLYNELDVENRLLLNLC